MRGEAERSVMMEQMERPQHNVRGEVLGSRNHK